MAWKFNKNKNLQIRLLVTSYDSEIHVKTHFNNEYTYKITSIS